jgi:hypothetical protein
VMIVVLTVGDERTELLPLVSRDKLPSYLLNINHVNYNFKVPVGVLDRLIPISLKTFRTVGK